MKLSTTGKSVTVVIFIVLLVCFEIFLPRVVVEPCLLINTINITGGHYLENGSFKFEDFVFEKGMFKNYNYVVEFGSKITKVKRHKRGCICALKPCIRLCDDYEDKEFIVVENEENIEEKIYFNDENNFNFLLETECYVYYPMENETDNIIFLKVSKINFN